ncbi:MAG: MipA/OmpV family protein [Opitutaceae bacterium]|nr:MipA/OmpV family protein [Opitutaceae bacterium]
MAAGFCAGGVPSGGAGPAPDGEPAARSAGEGPRWGLGMGLRYADVPFHGGDDTVADIVPLFFYEGRHVFFRGLEGGLHAWAGPRGEVNFLARYRFFDIPRGLQNEIRLDALDLGVQLRRHFQSGWRLDGEVLGDVDGRVQGIVRLGAVVEPAGWRFQPEVELRAKTSDFNRNYYGLGVHDTGAGADARLRLKVRRQVYRNLYLIGSAEAAFLDRAARSSPAVNDRMEWEAFLGAGFFNLPAGPAGGPQPLALRPYLRLAQGAGTDATVLEALSGKVAGGAAVRMTSLFYGYPLADNLMGLPVEVYLTPGLVHHYASSAQGAATEYVLAVKFYYVIPLPWRVRIGFAEGMSYSDSITCYEERILARNGYKTSRLLNFLDFSLDVNLGDMTGWRRLRGWWLGAGVHHRSGIFETSSMFGRIKGGSNFSTVYLQWSP